MCWELARGANPRILVNGETALHTAVRLGSPRIVEALLEGGALEWLPDSAGRTPLDVARASDSAARAELVALLDRTAIADPSFRSAVGAIHRGDTVALAVLLDAEPKLLHERNPSPAVYARRAGTDYFRNPKLLWYVANNPTMIPELPHNIVDVARTIIDRGVESADLDYTLELVMSSSTARERGRQLPLMRALLDAGASATQRAVIVAAAYGMLEPLRALVAWGYPSDAIVSAALGDTDALRHELRSASADDVATAFGLAVINRHVAAARIALEAGASIDAFLPVHAHSTALHQAVANDDIATIRFLRAAGARTDIRDRLWDATAHDWARYAGTRW